jgi:hypothetical protein
VGTDSNCCRIRDAHDAQARIARSPKVQEKRISDLEAYKAGLGPQILRLERRIAELEKRIRDAQPAALPH